MEFVKQHPDSIFNQPATYNNVKKGRNGETLRDLERFLSHQSAKYETISPAYGPEPTPAGYSLSAPFFPTSVTMPNNQCAPLSPATLNVMAKAVTGVLNAMPKDAAGNPSPFKANGSNLPAICISQQIHPETQQPFMNVNVEGLNQNEMNALSKIGGVMQSTNAEGAVNGVVRIVKSGELLDIQ